MRKSKFLATGILLLSMLCFSGTTGHAAHSKHSSDDPHKNAGEVFQQKEIDKLIKKANSRAVVQAKKTKQKNANSNAPSFFTISSDSKKEDTARDITGTYPTEKGQILVTSDSYLGFIPCGHSAIVYSPTNVVEAGFSGVTLGNNNWVDTKESIYGVSVTKTSPTENALAADWCYTKIDKPYNYNYFNTKTRDKFYCSQLIYAAFKDNFNIDLNTKIFGSAIHPMELVNNSNTVTIYRNIPVK